MSVVTIVGTGAMATLFAARLGPHVRIIMLGSWEDAVCAINHDGIHFDSGSGHQIIRVTATTDPAQCAGSQCALVLVKAWQTARAASQLTSFFSPVGVALTLQNGLGNVESLTDALGADRVALGTTTQGATLMGPGHVREGGRGPIHAAEHPRLTPLITLLRSAGFEVHLAPASTLHSLVWGKLVINAAINPLTALLGVPNGELLERPAARTLLASVVAEAAAVAEAINVRLPYPDPFAAVEAVARRTAANRSSMLQDVQRRAPTEIDAICGAIVQAGERAGVPTPVSRTLWQLVKAK